MELMDEFTEKTEFCWKSLKCGAGVGFFIALIISAIICVITSMYSDNKSQKMVYVDVDKVITDVTGRILETNDSEKASEELQEYRVAFDKALDNYSKKHNVIIFSSPKPIRGAEDKTNELINQAFGNGRLGKSSKLPQRKPIDSTIGINPTKALEEG